MVLVVFLISLAFGWIYQVTGSLWTSILSHFLVDFVLGLFIRFGWFQSREEDEMEWEPETVSELEEESLNEEKLD
jgi:hypothetical protein